MIKKRTKRLVFSILVISFLQQPAQAMSVPIPVMLGIVEFLAKASCIAYLIKNGPRDGSFDSLVIDEIRRHALATFGNINYATIDSPDALKPPVISDAESHTEASPSVALPTHENTINYQDVSVEKEVAQDIQKIAASIPIPVSAPKSVQQFSAVPSFSSETQYTMSNVPGGIRVDFKNGVWFSISVEQHGPARAFAEQRINTWRTEALQTIERMQTDPEFQKEVFARLNFYISELIRTNSLDDAQRIKARLTLVKLHNVELPEPYKIHFSQAIESLIRHYFNADGSLRITDRDQKTSNVLLECFNNSEIKNSSRCYQAPEVTVPAYNSGSAAWFLPKTETLVQRVNDNVLNEKTLRVIKKCQNYDFKGAENIIHQQPQHPILQKIYTQYHDEYQSLIFDKQGIYKIGLADPLYTSLSKEAKKGILHNKKLKTHLNNLLLVRYHLKETMLSQWGIDPHVPECVHQALYRIMKEDGSGLVDARALIDQVHEITQDYHSPDNRLIIGALFQSNGVLKDFAHYPRAQSLHISSDILSQQNHVIRRMLNHLLYQEHAFVGTAQARSASKALDYLQAACMEQDTFMKEIYEQFYRKIYHALSTGSTTVIDQLPLLSIAYTDAQQIQTHKYILKLVTDYIQVTEKTTITDPDSQRITLQLAGGIQNAHELNKSGNPAAATALLQKTLQVSNQELLTYDLPTVIENIKRCMTEEKKRAELKKIGTDVVDGRETITLPGPNVVGSSDKDVSAYGSTVIGTVELLKPRPPTISKQQSPEQNEKQYNQDKQKQIPPFETQDKKETREESEKETEPIEKDTEMESGNDSESETESGDDEASDDAAEEELSQQELDAKAEVDKKIKETLEGAERGEKTTGRARQFEKSGGRDGAIKDFEKNNPNNVRPIPTGKAGDLPDGRRINVRTDSSDGRPTLEIYNPKNKSSIKIRYT